MLDRMLVAAWLTVAALITPPADAVPPALAPAPAPTLKAAAHTARQAAEDTKLRELIPAPLTDAAISAMAARLGATSDATETVAELASRYRARVDAEHERLASAVRARLTNAFATTPAGALASAAGPELVAVLELSATWRPLLAAADNDLLRQLLIVRSDTAKAPPTLLAFERSVERDDAVSFDPMAGLRLPALLDAAQLTPGERRRVEDALDRHWTRTALAISARREARLRVELEHARLLQQWGPAWELTATPSETAARRRQLAELDALVRTAEDSLRAAVRESVTQVLRLVPQEAAARVREQVDTLVWPSLFVQEDLLSDAMLTATQGADPDLGDAMKTVFAELQRRLEPTRRELSRRAARSEELDAVVANVELGAHPQDAAAALAARLELLETVDRRRKFIRDTAVQLRHMATAGGAPNARALEERVAALDADIRSAEWLREGILDRIFELEQGGRERFDEMANEPAPPPQPETQP